MKTRKRFWFRCITVFVLLNLLIQTFYPTVAFALTGGPSQPEMQGFTPVGTTNMVDLSSGSFTYNIPLLDVEGYPINLSYHSGVTMDQEASWCGLGWNINPGEINRQMRGIPDDFNGDKVTESFNMRNNITAGLSAGVGVKIFGFLNANLNAGIFYNNYKGPGVTIGIVPSLATGVANKGTLNCGLGINFNSQSGVDISPTIGFSMEAAHNDQYNVSAGVKVGTTYNSRTGVKGLQMTKDLNVTQTTPVITADQAAVLSAISGVDIAPVDHVGSGDFSSTSSMSFSAPSYIPTIKMPLQNYAVTLDATIGAALFGVHPDYNFSGWFNEQTLATNSQTLPAYGYMYADQANNNPYAMHDFNREKDVPFLPQIANLPITNFTYDLYSISGEGVSGEFRPFRGDVGVLYDHENYNTSLSASLGIELGVGEVAHNGINVNVSTSNTTSDQWLGDNQFASTVNFQSLQPGNINYEPFYIKKIGEKTVNDEDYYATIGDVNPVYVSLDRYGSDVVARNMFNINSGRMSINSNLLKTEREKRNQCTSLLTAGEANFFGLDKSIVSYPINTNVYASNCAGMYSVNSTSRTNWPSWHTSEITVTNPDGKRYVYGIPAYNTVHNEATFSVSGNNYNPFNDSINVVNYSGSDRSTGNSKGLDNYYDEQSLPAYAHSYLLTGILSPDYVDMTGDGITDDDLGQAVKINYTRLYSQVTNNPYRWRVPVESSMANNQMGMMTDDQDDKGNIIYGEKEVWYVHSIESKTMVAQFIIANRQDGLGVINEDGGGFDNTRPLQCLQEIVLYSKADLIAHGANAVPIKTVHFVYDYSLCPGTPNSTAYPTYGKLTLKSVYFTYGNNTEGSLNSYQFSYNGYNPGFSHNNYDRWGYFKESKSNPGSSLNNQDFPYTSQNASKTDIYATAWNMTDINLPSGGHIMVKYEPNDYAYVQNQRAAQMFTLLGAAPAYNAAPTNQLFNINGWNNWLVVKIPVYENSRTNFANDYLAGLNQLYFRSAIDVDGSGHYEYVPGYANIADYEEVNDSTWAIELSEVSSGNAIVGSANPISLATWQYLRLNLPQYAYPFSQTNGSVFSMIFSVLGILFDVADIFVGFDSRMYVQGAGQNFIPDHTWIRLDNPTYQKLGGGTRVGEIDIADNWANMANGQSSYTYGQTYNYTTTLAVNGQPKTISSGVATYEPLQGGDENPLRIPLPYSQQQILAPNNEFYTETPLGESLYPSPGVVYSKVTVTDLQHPGIERTATGSTVNEFYTAYDFPVLNNWTDLDNERVKPNILTTLLNFGVKDYTTVSQGFTVEVNDMPGKEKGQEVYDQTGSEISSVHYYYHTDNPFAPSMHLNNDVEVINPDGTVATASIGKDIDTYEDMREQETTTHGYGATFNNEFFIFPFFVIPIDIPIIIPDYSSEDTRFRSAVTTKYIYRSGLVDSVVNIKYGSYVTTQNVAYDAETGNVLLTQTHNEFNEPLYNFTYPAHFAYDGMGPEYENIGAVVNTTVVGGEFTSLANPEVYFTPGDELEYYIPTGNLSSNKLWVTQPVNPGNLIVMDQSGNPVTLNSGNPVELKVIRSGRRNMSGAPVGSVETMNSPIVAGSILVNSSSNILQSNGTLFNDAWPVPITNVPTLNCITPDNTPSLTCIAQFMDSLIVHNEVFATSAAHITLGKYCPSCADTSDLYNCSVTPTGPNGFVNSFSAELGNCQLTLSLPVSFGLIIFTYEAGPCISYTEHDYSDGPSPPAEAGSLCVSCQQCTAGCANLAIGGQFNPYTIGMLGDWRPERNYVYYTDRTPTLTASTSNIWNTGLFQQYSPIWDVPIPGNYVWPLDTTDQNWTWTSKITKYDSKGNEVEDQDALGRYSSALYGYLQSVPVAVSSNAKFKEIGFDGFEDYGFVSTCGNICPNDHWDLINLISPSNTAFDTTSTQSHTGKYSLDVSPYNSATYTRSINYFNNVLYTTDATHFYLQTGGGIPLFSPDSGSYLLSAWVKENTCGQTGYPKDSIVVSYVGSALVYVFHSTGPIIDGWQRFESRFNVPGNATSINVKLVAGPHDAYYDDIRVEPFAAEMKSYVYDPSSLRLLGTLDENNYATIYEYNDEGILMRVKKETEKGIMTIKESRSSYVRKN